MGIDEQFPSRAAGRLRAMGNGSVMNLESSEREDHQVRVIDAENVGYSYGDGRWHPNMHADIFPASFD